MIRFFRNLLSSRSPLKLAHPIFGDIELHQGKRGPYWLREAYQTGELTIAIDTLGEAPPTEAQVQFFEQVTRHVDDTYQLFSAEMEARHALINREPVKSNWNETFRLAGLDVPLEGNRCLPWEVAFECLTNDSGFLYTCHFEQGAPAYITVDT